MRRDGLRLKVGASTADLTRLFRAAAVQRIRIEGFAWHDPYLILFTDPVEPIAAIADEMGIPREPEQVLLFEVPRGRLSDCFAALAARDITIRGASGLLGDRLTGNLMLRVDDMDAAEDALAPIVLGGQPAMGSPFA